MIRVAPHIESTIVLLTTFEVNYWRFLNSEIHESIMNIQDELENLSREFRIVSQQEERIRSIESMVQKIIVEMKKLGENGIEI